MSKSFNVLMVDDHPMVREIYRNALAHVKRNTKNFSFKVVEANNCDEALSHVKDAQKNSKKIDLVFLDICVPPSQDLDVKSGEDLGERIRSIYPTCKIIVSTSLCENQRLNSILKNLNPEGFLVKTDASFYDISMAVQNIVEDAPYYSKTIQRILRQKLNSGIVVDKIDRLLLHELASGTKMKDLPNIIPMSLAGIERRKRILKSIFNINNSDDKLLIEAAKQNGFL